jgi:hypothetical protein
MKHSTMDTPTMHGLRPSDVSSVGIGNGIKLDRVAAKEQQKCLIAVRK